MRALLLIGMAVALSLGGGDAAAAGGAQSEAAAGEQVTLPFAPPLERDLRYRLTITKPRPGAAGAGIIEQRLRFTRNGEGYLLAITPVRLTVQGQTIDLLRERGKLPAPMQPMFEPTVYEADSGGQVLRVRDWPGVIQRSRAYVEQIAAQEPDEAKRAQLRRMMKTMLDTLAAMSPDRAAVLNLQGWDLALGYGGGLATLGAAVEIDGEIDPGLGSGPVPTRGRFTVTRPAPDRYRLVEEQSLDRAKAGAMIVATIETLTGSDPAMAAQLQKLKGDMADAVIEGRSEVDLDAATGLPIRAMMKRTITVGGQPPAIQTTLIERLPS